MKNMRFFRLALLAFLAGCSISSSEPPGFIIGQFQDDYDIQYDISKDLWFQKPDAKFHIAEWNPGEQYLIARNDAGNPSGAGLYTRFDWMTFENMPPWNWGFCITVYNAETIGEAQNATPPDRENPQEGCNEFPFSRMKPAE